MGVRLLSEEQAAQEVLRLVKVCSSVSLAVAWATKSDVSDAILASGKLKRAVVGTHMYITHPDVLRQFSKHPKVRVINPAHPRLFHPKVYLFEKDEQAWAIVGSHNLTWGAFGVPRRAGATSNIEASVLIDGIKGGDLLLELLAFLDSSWAEGEDVDDDFLFAYERQYEANRQHLKALKDFHRVHRPKKGSTEPFPMGMSWGEFAKQTRERDRHDFEQRLELLKGAKRIFGARGSFDAMEPDERKAIAGTFGKVEEQLDGINWRWFGTMSGHGDFMHLVNQAPDMLSQALEHISPFGDVTEDQYRAFVEDFRAAFHDTTHKGNYPVASRLLAMKRPDQFVAVNSQNKHGLCEALGVAHTSLDLDNFWERIVVPVRLSAWWLAPRPQRKLDASLWDNRAAMLDCLYYVGDGD